MDYTEKYMKLNILAAQMTGYFSGTAKWDSSIPLKVRKEMLQYLIDVWKQTDGDSLITQEWIKNWEKDIENLSA